MQQDSITAKSEDLPDKERCEVAAEELDRFEKIISGHKNLLIAIGRL